MRHGLDLETNILDFGQISEDLRCAVAYGGGGGSGGDGPRQHVEGAAFWEGAQSGVRIKIFNTLGLQLAEFFGAAFWTLQAVY